jgi:predicted AAA+ superfamily ATPase
MEILFEKFFRKVERVSLSFKRSLISQINWEAKLIGIKGARGVGKTTLLLQYIKQNLPLDHQTLYVSLDNIWFAENKLSALTDTFVKQGGKFLFVDEVHKYPNWSQELKNIYDDYPDLKVVFTGSSLLEILNSRADLSRRAVVYEMQGLSFREYLELQTGKHFVHWDLEYLLSHHVRLAQEITKVIRPLEFFSRYLKMGYFPYALEQSDLYYHRMEEVINMILEIELPLLRKVDVTYVNKLKQLLHVIAESAPFVPNVTKLSERIGINRNTFITYLYFLQEAHLTRNLYKDAAGITQLQKPDKIFLENTNFHYALAPKSANEGAIRETFTANQLGYRHQLEYTENGDFVIDGQVTFEVGGRKKSSKQLEGIANGYVLADGIEVGWGNKIPIWMVGFLY